MSENDIIATNDEIDIIKKVSKMFISFDDFRMDISSS